jgi:hypothetical protein
MIEPESMAVVMPVVEGHPNRIDFRGVLTVLDRPSERAPNGAYGHRVILTRAGAEEALPSLIGMALDYAPEFDRHDARRKVGIITTADVVGRRLEIGGYLYGKDFPEIIKEVAKFGRKPFGSRARKPEFKIRSMGVKRHTSVVALKGEAKRLSTSLADAVLAIRSLTATLETEMPRTQKPIVLRAEAAASGSGSGLGMSFEVTDVNVVDKSARLWIVDKVTFTGAAILRKNKAAYEDTWIELC